MINIKNQVVGIDTTTSWWYDVDTKSTTKIRRDKV